MQKLNLTKTNIAALQLSEKAYLINDEEMPYLYLRIGKTKKTFYFRRWFQDAPVEIKIGDAMTMNPVLARKKAEELAGQMAAGVDPRKPTRTRITLREAYEDFKAVRELRPGTVRTYDTAILTQLKELLSTPIDQITSAEILEIHKRYGKADQKQYGNQVMRTLRSVLNFAKGNYRRPDGTKILTENPVGALSESKVWFKTKRRKTVIEPNKLGQWLDCIASLDNHVAGDLYLLLLLTGLRREEATTIRWRDVKFNESYFVVPDSTAKNGQDHSLPMTVKSRQIFERRYARRINGWVFPGADTHVVNTRRHRDMIVEVSEIIFTPHDLRRTFTTVAESLNFNQFLIKRLLNHKTDSDVTGGYIVWAPERLRLPLQLIEDRIQALATGVADLTSLTSMLSSVDLLSPAH